MNEITYVIPHSTLRWLDAAPPDRAIALLIRHSVRGPLPPDGSGYAIPITDVGVRLAEELGALIGSRLRSLYASPLVRCVQTAEALGRGARVPLEVRRDCLLGDHGVFVHDNRLAWNEGWARLGHEGVMARLVGDRHPLPGMAAPDPAARYLVHHMLAASSAPGVHMFCTHDSIVTATAARILGLPLGVDAWPWYLEAAVFWRDGDRVEARYRHHEGALAAPLCDLGEEHVLELARRELLGVVGSKCAARFYLAGGAFKSLLTGRSPRDLDLWAASPEDRTALLSALESRGARRVGRERYSDVFELRDRRIDVPDKADRPTLEERLGRFDLAISAIGVEHAPGDRWRAVIDPRAVDDLFARRVSFLKPLVNWRHALCSLVRARSYAAELDYVLPDEEVEEVWKVFEAQDREMQLGMIERLMASGRARGDVLEEARCRLR